MKRLFQIATALLLAAGLMACGGGPDDPEQQVRAMILEAEQAAEQGNTRRIMRHISDNYRDDDGRGKDDIRNYVRGYLLQQNNPQLSTRIRDIDIVTPVRARARLEVRLADSTAQRARALSRTGGNLALELTLDREADDQWRVVRADWSQDR